MSMRQSISWSLDLRFLQIESSMAYSVSVRCSLSCLDGFGYSISYCAWSSASEGALSALMVAESDAHLGCSSSDRFGDMDLSVSPRRGRRMRGLSFEDLESVGARHTRVFPLDSFEDGLRLES